MSLIIILSINTYIFLFGSTLLLLEHEILKLDYVNTITHLNVTSPNFFVQQQKMNLKNHSYTSKLFFTLWKHLVTFSYMKILNALKKYWMEASRIITFRFLDFLCTIYLFLIRMFQIHVNKQHLKLQLQPLQPVCDFIFLS